MQPAPAPAEPPPVPKDGMPLARARSRLAAVWLSAAGIVFGLLILQSLLGKYENRVQQAWSWALPTMMPTLTLMLSVLGADALRVVESETAYVKKSFFHLAFWMSLAYLSLILVTILIEPLVSYSSLATLVISLVTILTEPLVSDWALDLVNLSHHRLVPSQDLVARGSRN